MPSEETMLKTIKKVTPLLTEMERDELVRLWQNTVEEQAQSKDATFRAACEKFLDDIDAEFVSERLKGSYLKEGLLSFLGYHVGRRANLPASKRRALLSAIYRRPTPRDFPRNYQDVWGDPGTPKRLERMVRTIVRFINEPKWRKDPSMEDAIAEWKEDLAYLRQAHFQGGFSWPAI